MPTASYDIKKFYNNGPWGQFFEQMLMLSSDFKSDQIYKCVRDDISHTWLC